MKKLIAFLLLTLSCNLAHAGLVWDAKEGWIVEGTSVLSATDWFKDRPEIKNEWDLMEAAKAACECGKYRLALSLYEKVYCSACEPKLAAEALYRTGCIYMSRHQFEQAFRTFQKIIIDYPTYPRFNEVIETQFKLAQDLQFGKRPYYWGFIPGLRDYGLAITYFESIVANAPFSKYAPMALMNIAELACRHKQPEDVIDALERLVMNYRESDLAPRAYIFLAKTYYDSVPSAHFDQGMTQKAVHYYQDFLFLFPNHELTAEAENGLACAREKLSRSKLLIADFYYCKRNNPCAARIYYNEAITVAPESASAETAKCQLAKIERGELPRKGICDYLFGRYQPLCTPAYLDEVQIARRENAEFAHLEETVNLNDLNDELVEERCYGDGEFLTPPPEGFDNTLVDEGDCVSDWYCDDPITP